MMSRRCFLISAALALLQAPAHSQESIVLTLREAVRAVRDRHVEVVVANERVRQSLSRIGQARSAFLPQVSAGLSGTRQTRNLEASGIELPRQDPLVGPFNVFDARLRLTQTLFDETALRRLEAARAGRNLSEAEVRKAQEDIMALAATLYVAARQAKASLNLSETLLKRDEDRLAVARTRFKSGVGTDLQVALVEQAYTATRQSQEAAVTDELQKRLDLIAVLGFPLDSVIEYGPETDLLSFDIRSGTEAAKDHPDVLASAERLRIRRAELQISRADYYPKASASADVGAIGKSPSSAEGTYTMGAQVSVPVFEGGQRRSRVQELESQVKESEERLADAERNVRNRVLTARQVLERAELLLETRRSELILAEKNEALAGHREKSGLGTRLETGEAQAQSAVVRHQVEEAAAVAVSARINLVHAMGHMEWFAEDQR